MPTQKKIDVVGELTQKVTKAKSMILADFQGLKHKQLEELRKKLKASQGEFVVTKNKLLIRALGDKAKAIENDLRDSTATLFSYADEVSALKELMKFFKAAGVGKTKSGLLGSTYLSTSDVTRLSNIPNREVLLGKLAGQLQAPISGLHYAMSWNIRKLMYALNAVKETKAKV
jgi:large subunit ribosomal protein L10